MPQRVSAVSADPRDILLAGRPEAVSDEDLLCVLVGEEGARHLGSLLPEGTLPHGLYRVCGEELVTLRGIGPARAARLLACVEMTRRAARAAHDARPTNSTPEDVVALCAPQLRGRDREHFWTLALNTKNRLLRTIEVSIGSLSASIVHPRELFKEAVRLSAASVVVVHNHPSGDPAPSGADIQLTRRLIQAGEVLGIHVLDHVIIGDAGQHASLKELGLM